MLPVPLLVMVALRCCHGYRRSSSLWRVPLWLWKDCYYYHYSGVAIAVADAPAASWGVKNMDAAHILRGSLPGKIFRCLQCGADIALTDCSTVVSWIFIVIALTMTSSGH